MAEVILANVTKAFGKTVAVNDISLHVEDGAFVVLLGPTGAGKTTTLRLIAGLERADGGRIAIGGHDVSNATPADRNVAMVFQQYSLYPHMNVRDNLAFPLRSPLHRQPEGAIARKVDDVAEVLRIAHKLDNKATALSGGEMQRVSIGRALVRDPAIYLMDEPLSSLDAKLRAELRIELKRIQSDLGATLLYVTHDQIEAMTMATHVGVLDHGQLVQFGTPRAIYEDPDSIYVAERLGLPRINVIDAGLFPGNYPAGTASLGLRPENIAIDSTAPGARESRIDRVEHLGDQTRLHVRIGDAALVTLADPHTRHQAGETLSISPVAPMFFDREGKRVRERA